MILPWVGGRSVRLEEREWKLVGKLPEEYGWFTFKVEGRKARCLAGGDQQPLRHQKVGYLVGDRLVSDEAAPSNPHKLVAEAERVHLIEEGLDRFVRVRTGRAFEGGPLIYVGQEMPLGPEDEALNHFLNPDETEPKVSIRGATPALYAALELELYHRAEATRRRAELARRRQEEEARLALEHRRRELTEKLGDGAGRRAMAQVDFEQAARAALAVGGAEYLDHRKGRGSEMVVRFRLDRQRFECVCDLTLNITDAGICLTAHDDDQGFEEGTKGDTFFTLESLPSVIREAQRDRKLVVYRHVDG